MCYPHSGDLRVYNALGDHNQPETRLIPVPRDTDGILPAPDDSQIVIHNDNLEVWSTRRLMDTNDSTPHAYAIRAIDLSPDASLLAIVTKTTIEIWDARISQRRDVIQTPDCRLVAFSPRGELIVFSSEDEIFIMDAQASVPRPMRYLFVTEQGLHAEKGHCVRWAGISFDSSRIAAKWGYGEIWIWDLSSGTVLHALGGHDYINDLRWSRTDLYLLCKDYKNSYSYLDAETFKEEFVRKPDDRFQKHDRLYHDSNKLRIRSSRQRNRSDDPLFLALPSHLDINTFCWHGDRVCIDIGERVLLLEISCLDTYMNEYCHIEFEPEGELRKDIQYSLVNNHTIL